MIDEELEYTKSILRSIRIEIEKIPGVVGTGITHSVVTGVQLPGVGYGYHLVVYLERDEDTIKRLIPKYIYEIPIIFEVTGKLEPLGFKLDPQPFESLCFESLCFESLGFESLGFESLGFTGRYRPVKAGVSINNGNSSCSSGTLAGFAKDSQGRDVLVSNNHVIALNFSDPTKYTGKKGDPIIQPSCGNGGKISTDKIAELEYWIKVQNGGPDNKIDAAFAVIDSGIEIADLNACDWEVKSSVEPVVGMDIKKAGRTTGCTTGSITAVDVSGNVDYSSMGSSSAHFIDQFKASIDLGAGDSGSLIQTDNGDAVGLLFTSSIFNKIKNVEELLGVTFGNTSSGCYTPTVIFGLN